MNALLLATSGVSRGAEVLRTHISAINDNGVEAAAKDALFALNNFKAVPSNDGLADLYRAGRGLKSQLSRHYNYFGPKESQSLEKSIGPLLDAITRTLITYEHNSFSQAQVNLTLQVVTECRYFVFPRSRVR